MAFWGIEIKPGKPYVHQYDDERGRLHLSQATLGSGSSKEKAILVCNVGDKKPVFLCSLFPKRMETCSLNVEFEEYDEVILSVEGPHSIHLSGFYYGEKPDSDGDDYDSDSYEDVSFEVESDSEDHTDSDAEDEEDDLSDSDMDMYPSLPKANTGVRIEEIVDDEEPDNDKAMSERKKKKINRGSDYDNSVRQQIVLKSSSTVPVLESEDEDGFPMSSPNKSIADGLLGREESIEKSKDGQAKRKRGTDDPGHTGKIKKVGSVGRDDPASKPADVSAPTPEVDDEKAKKKKNKKKGEKVMQDAGNNSNREVKPEEDNNQEPTSKKVAKSADSVGVKTYPKEKIIKEDKKKNKQQESAPSSKVKGNAGQMNGSATEDKPFQTRTFANGLVVEELQMGQPNGKRASPGKKVSVRYIGKLQKNGKIFDSNIGKAPFKFTLGVGQVIKGWDVGVNGMRVGDKRRLTIPPAMGYGPEGAGSAIPPNSWLVFDVELVDVR